MLMMMLLLVMMMTMMMAGILPWDKWMFVTQMQC